MFVSFVSPRVFVVLVFAVGIAITLNPTYAKEGEIFYNGDANFDLNSGYIAGENIETNIELTNMESFPIADAYLVIEILEGCETLTYPSQNSDCDNVFFEKVVSNITLDSLGKMTVPFSYKLPDDLKSGTYRMDVFLRTKKTPIVGMVHIFVPGKSTSFFVTGSGSESSIKILRTKTQVLGFEGPIGSPSKPGATVDGSVYVENLIDSSQDGLTMHVSLCPWDDTECANGGFIVQKIYSFSLNSKETKEIDIFFTAPMKPDAYAIRLEVKDKALVTRSLYRNRLIVTGETAKIRKLWINKRYYAPGEKAELNTLIFTSPDHYTSPFMYGVKLLVSVKDLNADVIVFQKTEVIPELSDNVVYVSKNYEFVTGSVLQKFEICAQLSSKDDLFYDSYCYVIDSTKFTSKAHNYRLDKKVFDKETSEFSAELCVTDASGMPVFSSADISVTDLGKQEYVLKDNINIDPCHQVKFAYRPDVLYRMVINDKEARKQSKFEIQYYEESAIPSSNVDNPDSKIDDGKDKIPETQDNNFIIMGIFVILAAIFAYIYIKTRKK